MPETPEQIIFESVHDLIDRTCAKIMLGATAGEKLDIDFVIDVSARAIIAALKEHFENRAISPTEVYYRLSQFYKEVS